MSKMIIPVTIAQPAGCMASMAQKDSKTLKSTYKVISSPSKLWISQKSYTFAKICIFCELSLNGLGKCCFVLFQVGYERFMYLSPDSHKITEKSSNRHHAPL